jgi:hypothetical protein
VMRGGASDVFSLQKMARNVNWFPLGTSNKFSSATRTSTVKISSKRTYFCNFVGNLRPGVLASSIVLQPVDAITQDDIRLVRQNKGVYVRDREQVVRPHCTVHAYSA